MARVALNGLHLHDAVGVVRQADVDRHLGIGRVNVVEDVLAQDRAIERGRALALRQIDLEPGVGAAVRFMKIRLGVAAPGSAGCGGSRCR